ncbi:MAG TPA: glucoamylase family protein [Vicinamibacterales bacterium]|nr:glucoamylase family protein [Vicinamibacterales bacterium]
MSAAVGEPVYGALETAARELSGRHTAVESRARPLDSLQRVSALTAWLDRARAALADPAPEAAKAAEWLLDNDYLVERAIRQIQEDLPPGFYRRLPGLAQDEEERRLPRAYALAHGFLRASHLHVSLPAAIAFAQAYQKESAWLTIAELWAFPALLRLASLELLVTALARLVPDLESPILVPAHVHVPVDDTECVARSLTNLGRIAAIPWKTFFEATSRVEAILRTDPAGAYERMDFQTRDRYRVAVEEIAAWSGRGEVETALQVIAQSDRLRTHDPDCGHVGYWLIGEGRGTFERIVGCRPPARVSFWRWSFRHAGPIYATALVSGTAAALALPVLYLWAIGASVTGVILSSAIALLPGSVVAVTMVHWVVTRLVPPRVLPKLDFDRGIPPDWSTAVVIPALVGSTKEAEDLLAQLEEHYLANPASSVQFALLTDPPDAPVQRMPNDEAIEAALVDGIRNLNARHADNRFHVLHRHRRLNPSEGCWMGWERKRGKLEQFNRLVLGDPGGGFDVYEGRLEALRQIRFVVTVDADTRLPQGAVARLVGALAHPLNRPQFDEATGRVRSGYTVVQPRVEISPESGNRSLFARLYSGDTAIDIYSRAVSDVYQDLLGSGIYIGKGIYDVEAFQRSVEGRVPENALASHDLFEGAHGRVALATDIVVYENFPSQYEVFARRWHRWMRGDWQLLPWLGRHVPGAAGTRIPNGLPYLERWKIADNLRRSLMAPTLIALLIAGWLVLPGSPWMWTTLALLAPAAALFTDLVTGLAGGRRRGAVRGVLRNFVDHAGRWILTIVFLVQDAVLCIDAILRTLWRLYASHRKLLEWTTAAHVAHHFNGGSPADAWRRLWVGPATAVVLGGAVLAARPDALATAAPLLMLWVASPMIAWRIGHARATEREPLDEESILYLRRLARRTWLFFERFAGPDDHWLPPDNYQEHPGGELAHRTSPTNTGMLLLSSVSAWDLGFVGVPELAARVRNTLDTLHRLERHHGHFFNWYDTRMLIPLEPRYVSTVDSGNLAVSLLTLKEACREAARGPALGTQLWKGLRDLFDLLDTAAEDLPASGETDALRSVVRALATRATTIAHEALAATTDASVHSDRTKGWSGTLVCLCGDDRTALDQLVTAAVSRQGIPSRTLQDIRVWVERIHHHLRSMERDVETLAPWLRLIDTAPAGGLELAERLRHVLPPSLSLDDVAARCQDARHVLATATSERADGSVRPWIERLIDAVEAGERGAASLRDALTQLADRAEALALDMDFRPLFDAEPKLFRIGYNATADRLDPHHYDLLASEARLASFFAIAKGDVPLEHWFHLGRPITSVGGRLTLVSWGGSMFEYLMPALLLRRHPGGLLAESEHAAVDAHRRFARDAGIPWGMSESGFASLDPSHHYRYQAFGVPTIGLRRGLSRELVVAPYATALALLARPHDAVANLRELERLGMLGLYGMYEAADFRAEHATREARFGVVRSWMAHHQGMALAAIDNVLCNDTLVRRFHADRRVRTVEVLLQERVPRERPTEAARSRERAEAAARRPVPALPEAWDPVGPPGVPKVQLLGNGRMSSWISESGAGALHWQGQALTRWIPDPTRDHCGLWIYVRDEDSGQVWSVGRQPTGVVADEAACIFHAHLAEFRQRNHRIAIRMDVGVLPADDLEARRLSVANEDDRRRTLTLTTYGEVVLGPPRDDERHPAFSKLFVNSEWLPAARGLLFTRRPRHSNERPPVLLHAVILDPSLPVEVTGYETDRRAFLGRHGNPRRPRSVVEGLTGAVGWTLDPIFALQVRVMLDPGQRAELCFVTAAAGSRELVLKLAERYDATTAVDWAIQDAAITAAQEATRLRLRPSELPDLQTLASLLLAPHAALRASASQRAANRLGQSRLWGTGISGDAPILLLRTSDPRSELLPVLVRGHELWRRRGLQVDLVVLRSGTSTYAEPLRERLTDLLEGIGAHGTLAGSGGVHLVIADQIPEEEARLLECAARVVLDDTRGNLARQMVPLVEPADLPPLQPVHIPAAPPVLEVDRHGDLLFDNGFGGFSPDGREYVIHLPPGSQTPAPWCNVLANDAFGCLVSESGLGFTWSQNSGENRLTPWTNDPVLDPPGEALYLRDEEDARIWTPTPSPAGRDAACEVRHGAGYTIWAQRSHGFEQRLTVFVPPDGSVKIARLQLKNLWNRPRRVTATYYVEWQLGALPSVARPQIVTAWDPRGTCLLASSAWSADFGERVAFLTSTLRPHGVTTDRREFLGLEGDLAAPAALRRWGLSGRAESATDPCACYQVHLDVAADASAEAVFILGQGDTRQQALDLAQCWRDPARVDGAWAALHAHWDHVLGAVRARTPDPALDLMVNRWLLYQTMASRVLARAGFYQAGGAIGFRDQLQDVLALLHADPTRTRAHILACAARQFEEGDVLHWWHPPSARGVRTRCSDDLLWLPWATTSYIEATGDRTILDEEVPFLRAPALAPHEKDRYARFELSPDRRSLFEHCQRALERAVTRGAHGLPLIGTGDWNDGMDRVGAQGKGESVWLAWFAIAVMNGFAALCRDTRHDELGEQWQRRAREMARAVEETAWDGEWYVRAFDDDGRPWGSRQNDECRIDALAQAWAVLSDVADPERARQAVLAAERELLDERERLIRLLWPPFDRTPRDPGYIKAYPPGIRENGGQYTHAAAWLGLAYAARHDATRASRVLQWLNPITRSATREAAEHHRTEPYVLAADIGAVAPHAGCGGWTWYTGSAAWTWRLAVEGILGLRLRNGRLRIEPCLPPEWERFEAQVRRNGGTLAITVEVSSEITLGRRETVVDGIRSEEPDVAFPPDGATRSVHVRIGRQEMQLPTPVGTGAMSSCERVSGLT